MAPIPQFNALRPAGSEISEHFGTTLPRRTIYILVELPAPRESGFRISFSAIEA
jgi:hypothetical protein